MLQPSAPHPVVVCWRGPENSPAIHLGLAFARALGEPLILAQAYAYEPAAWSPAPSTTARNDARERAAHAALDQARQWAPADLELTVKAVPALDLAEGLHELATGVDASMLVVGRDREGHDLARRVLHRAPCPVAVPSGREDTVEPLLPGRIGVAYDDSPAARNAVRVARSVARIVDGRVQLICVDGDLGPWPALIGSGAALAVDAEPQRLHGDPATALRHAAQDLDLLVCGTHGRGRLASAVLGSVSGALVRDCPCPLLVVPAPARRRAATPLGIVTAAS